MNAARRKEIRRAERLIGEAMSILSDVVEAEREAFDNLPGSLQDGDRGQAMSDTADALEEIVGALEGCDFSQFEA